MPLIMFVAIVHLKTMMLHSYSICIIIVEMYYIFVYDTLN